MQINRSQSFATLPPPYETARERAASETGAPPVQTQVIPEPRATRAIEEIRSAERMLDRQQAYHPQGAAVPEGRQQRAAAAYQSWQQSDERAYVSEVLGIDVYA